MPPIEECSGASPGAFPTESHRTSTHHSEGGLFSLNAESDRCAGCGTGLRRPDSIASGVCLACGIGADPVVVA
jgi:hypothetical protein